VLAGDIQRVIYAGLADLRVLDGGAGLLDRRSEKLDWRAPGKEYCISFITQCLPG